MFSHYRSYSLFKRNLRTLFLICMAAMLLITILVSAVYAQALLQELSGQALRTATILSSNMDRLFQNLQLAGAALVKDDSAVQKLMFDLKYSYGSYVEGLTAAWQIQGVYPNVLFLACYNPYQDSIFSTVAMTEEASLRLRDWLHAHPLEPGDCAVDIFDIKMQGEQEIDDPLPTMVLFTASKADAAGKAGVALVGIDCGAIQSYLSTAAEQNQGMVYLLDERGRVMSHSDLSQVLMDYSDIPYVQTALHAKEDAGIFSAEVDGQRRIVAYSKNDMRWTLVTIVPPNSLLSRLFLSKDLRSSRFKG